MSKNDKLTSIYDEDGMLSDEKAEKVEKPKKPQKAKSKGKKKEVVKGKKEPVKGKVVKKKEVVKSSKEVGKVENKRLLASKALSSFNTRPAKPSRPCHGRKRPARRKAAGSCPACRRSG